LAFSTDLAGGVTNVSAGATAHNVFVSSGGTLNVFGTITSLGGVSSGGVENILSGGVASGVLGSGTAVSGGTVNVLSGGSLAFSTDFAGGVTNVSAGGTADNLHVQSGGTLNDFGTITSAVTVLSGGTLIVQAGGTASGVVNRGGLDLVLGTAIGATIESGGTEVLANGGTVNGATVSSGGTDDVTDGGTGSGATVASGGLELVESGGIDRAVTISGGTFEVASGGSTGSSPVTFAGGSGGTLRLDASLSFGGLVAGFGAGDDLDLRDISFGSATSTTFTEAASNLSGTLTITNGVSSASITLLGQYTAGQFTTASDGAGGTLIGETMAPAAAATSATLAASH
jgi:autotransporter passenger strand-loop-strand repeat protein